MRFKLFLIFSSVIILSLASGFGLKFVFAAWQEPTASPPEGNVPAPINVGSADQSKAGGLTIGGVFRVKGTGSGAVIGTPTGDNMGPGTLNAEQLCIQGVCQSSWPIMLNAFVDEGNVGFGPTAVLGTNDNVPLAFETNNTERMRIDTAGNVGIGITNPGTNLEVANVIRVSAANPYIQINGTYAPMPNLATIGIRSAGEIVMRSNTNNASMVDWEVKYGQGTMGSPYDDAFYVGRRTAPTSALSYLFYINNVGNVGIGTTTPNYKLVVAGNAPRAYIWSTSGNPELNLGDGTNHWAIYRDTGTDQLRFWRGDNRMVITSDGKVGIGTTNPLAKLEVYQGDLSLRDEVGATRSILFKSTHGDATVGSIDAKLSWWGLDYLRFRPLRGNGGGNFGSHFMGVVDSPAGYPTSNQHLSINTDSLKSEAVLYVDSTGGRHSAVFMNGNVGIGTNNPNYKLVIAGASPREYIWPSGGGNPELDFGNVAGDSHWAIYRDLTSDELRFWRGDNNVIMTAQGDINSRRCFGPVYVGLTEASYTGNLNGAANVGYDDANALCAATIPGSHICTASEILETIKCNRASLPTSGQAWISNGPPGYTARANDCTGWTSTSPAADGSTVYGAIWAFDANGGVGWVTTCNMSLKFACCK